MFSIFMHFMFNFINLSNHTICLRCNFSFAIQLILYNFAKSFIQLKLACVFNGCRVTCFIIGNMIPLTLYC